MVIIKPEILWEGKIASNEEWEGKELQWFAFKDIHALDDNNMMEGLMYLKEQMKMN